MAILAELTCKLRTAAQHLPERLRRQHVQFIAQAQDANTGGYCGRSSTPDIYYTDFALNCLALVGTLEETTARRAMAFVLSQLQNCNSLIDLLAGIDALQLLGQCLHGETGTLARQAVQRLAKRLQAFRSQDGGYNLLPAAASASTYATCLVGMTLQEVAPECFDIQQARHVLLQRQTSDGGFCELAGMHQGATNPTAAVVSFFCKLAQKEVSLARAIDFLHCQRMNDGGFRATPQTRQSDLLSTFTATVALHRARALSDDHCREAARFATMLAHPNGGFISTPDESTCDVEYTYYGLALLCLTEYQKSEVL